MININNLSKSFDNFEAIRNVNIEVESGTIHGLIGENGAGKTTIIKCATGIYKPDSGNVLINGDDVYENPKVKSKIGYVADSNQFFLFYRVKEMVNFFKEIYKNFDENKFKDLNSIFKLPYNKRIVELSKGMKMRLSIMLSISIMPEVLILDEPTSGLDAIAKRQVLDIIIDEVEKRGITVLISSHHLSELEKLCDKITIIHQGEITYQSDIEKLKNTVKKLQVVFKKDVDLSDISNLCDIEKIGSVYYIITKDYNEKLKNILLDKGAEIIEEIGMSLEDIFVYTNRK